MEQLVRSKPIISEIWKFKNIFDSGRLNSEKNESVLKFVIVGHRRNGRFFNIREILNFPGVFGRYFRRWRLRISLNIMVESKFEKRRDSQASDIDLEDVPLGVLSTNVEQLRLPKAGWLDIPIHFSLDSDGRLDRHKIATTAEKPATTKTE